MINREGAEIAIEVDRPGTTGHIITDSFARFHIRVIYGHTVVAEASAMRTNWSDAVADVLQQCANSVREALVRP